MRETGAQRLPTAALSLSSGRPVVPASVTSGMAIDPNATGAVLASRQIADAVNAVKPRPVSMVAATATGSAEARRAFKKRSECESNQKGLQAMVGRQSADRVLDDLELTGHLGHAKECDCPKHDPRNGKEPEGSSMKSSAHSSDSGHVISPDGKDKGDSEAGKSGQPRRLTQDAEQDQQGEDRSRSNKRGNA